MGELITLYDDVPGDHMARARIVVTNESAFDHATLIWGIRSRHYSAEPTAALVYGAQELTPRDTATAVTVGGRAAIQHPSLLSAWTPVLSTDMLVGDALTHVGTYRIWATVWSGSSPQVRLVWDVGDLVLPEENTATTVPAAGSWFLVDLGEVRLDAAPVGSHLWRGIIQANPDQNADRSFAVAKLYIVPVDEGYGVLRAPSYTPAGVVDYAARDEFTGITAGVALNARVAPVGGTWVTSGDADDYLASDALLAETMARTTNSDTASGRFALLGAVNMSDVAVSVDVYYDYTNALGAPPEGGAVARWVDANNYVRARACGSADASGVDVSPVIEKVVAGVPTTLVGFDHVPAATWRRVRLIVLANGYGVALKLDQSGTVIASVDFYDADLAPGGALATGKPGFYDSLTSASRTANRYYDNFAIWIPDTDSVLRAGQTAELRHDGMFRATADGSGWGPVTHVTGSLPRIPPSGMEERPAELLVVTSRGELNQTSDAGSPADGLAVTTHVRPTWLFTP